MHLIKLGLSDNWLKQEIDKLNIDSSDEVFFAYVSAEKELHVSLKKDIANKDSILPLFN